jgi:hypothetical protein
LFITIRDGESKHEKQMIANGEGELNQDVLVLGNQFKIKYDQLVEAKNYGQCAMVLVKNVTTTIISDRFLRA